MSTNPSPNMSKRNVLNLSLNAAHCHFHSLWECWDPMVDVGPVSVEPCSINLPELSPLYKSKQVMPSPQLYHRLCVLSHVTSCTFGVTFLAFPEGEGHERCASRKRYRFQGETFSSDSLQRLKLWPWVLDRASVRNPRSRHRVLLSSEFVFLFWTETKGCNDRSAQLGSVFVKICWYFSRVNASVADTAMGEVSPWNTRRLSGEQPTQKVFLLVAHPQIKKLKVPLDVVRHKAAGAKLASQASQITQIEFLFEFGMFNVCSKLLT